MSAVGKIIGGLALEAIITGAIIITIPTVPATGGTTTAALQAEYLALLEGLAIIDMGFNELFNIDELTEQCKEAYTPIQPIILQITVRNATFKSLRLPGNEKLSSSMTATDIFDDIGFALESDNVIVNNGDDFTVFFDKVSYNREDAELTARGDVLITDLSKIADPSQALLFTEDYQLYVGSKEIQTFVIDANGNSIKDNAVGILSENFFIATKENFLLPDYVFAPNYKTRTLGQLERYIKENKHLPDVISQKEVERDGYYSIPKMAMGQLKNLEELYLHAFKQEEDIETLKIKQQHLKSRLQKINDALNNY